VKQQLKRRTEGFTIIEVLIVLAIAGLILLIVFLAVPALQRNSRNTRRRNDVAKSMALFQEHINNSNGTPATGTTVPTPMAVANASYGFLTTVDYNIHASAFQALVAAGNLATETVYIRNFSTCTGNIGVTGGTSRQYTATYLVESPGTAAAAPVPANFTAQCQNH